MKGYFNDFRDALGFRESGNRYNVVNTYGYVGRYQFGKERLWDLGISLNGWKPSGWKSNGWKWYNRDKITVEKFLADKKLQDTLFSLHVDLLMDIVKKRFIDYLNRKIGGVMITESGLVAGMHLKGEGGVKRFLESGKSNVDGYGTEITEYINKFSGYCLRYASKAELQEQFIWIRSLEIKPLDVIV